MERTFDVPHAAAGPLVTPTKPIFSVSFAAWTTPERSAVPANAASVIDMRAARLATITTSPDPAWCGFVREGIKRPAEHFVNDLHQDWIQSSRFDESVRSSSASMPRVVSIFSPANDWVRH